MTVNGMTVIINIINIFNKYDLNILWTAQAFNQPIGNWNISKVKFNNNMFKNSGYTHEIPTKPIPSVMSKEEFEKCEKMYCKETEKWEVHCVT